MYKVWAQEQEEGSRKQFDSQEQFVPWKLQRKHMQCSQTSSTTTDATTDTEATAAVAAAAAAAAVPQHAVVDAASDSLVLQRYCHVFAQGELEYLTARLQGLRVLDSGYDKGNWHVQLERTPHQVRVKT
jgi:zona occludens toxin (predicted ATPase)